MAQPAAQPAPPDRPEISAGNADSRPILVELGAVGGGVPWLPGARRWRAERSPVAQVADLGDAPLVELAFRLGGASEWAIVFGSGGEMAALRLLESAPPLWWAAIVPPSLATLARRYAGRVKVASSEGERWVAACDLLRERVAVA